MVACDMAGTAEKQSWHVRRSTPNGSGPASAERPKSSPRRHGRRPNVGRRPVKETTVESSLGERLGAIRGGMRGDRSTSVGAKIGRLIFLAAGLILLLVLLPSTVTYINPGHVGILIHRAGGGVDPKPMGPGLHPRNPLLSQIEEYPVFMQTLVLTRGNTEGSRSNDEINVNSVEGQPISLDVSMSFELDPRGSPALYQTFRTDIETIQHGYVKQSIRQALQEVVGTEPIADVIGPKKAEVGEPDAGGISQRLAPYGIRRQAVHDQRAARAAGRHRCDQHEERDAATGAHGAERAAEERVPGAG